MAMTGGSQLRRLQQSSPHLSTVPKRRQIIKKHASSNGTNDGEEASGAATGNNEAAAAAAAAMAAKKKLFSFAEVFGTTPRKFAQDHLSALAESKPISFFNRLLAVPVVSAVEKEEEKKKKEKEVRGPKVAHAFNDVDENGAPIWKSVIYTGERVHLPPTFPAKGATESAFPFSNDPAADGRAVATGRDGTTSYSDNSWMEQPQQQHADPYYQQYASFDNQSGSNGLSYSYQSSQVSEASNSYQYQSGQYYPSEQQQQSANYQQDTSGYDFDQQQLQFGFMPAAGNNDALIAQTMAENPAWLAQQSYLPQRHELSHMTAPIPSGGDFHAGYNYVTQFKCHYNYYDANDYVATLQTPVSNAATSPEDRNGDAAAASQQSGESFAVGSAGVASNGSGGYYYDDGSSVGASGVEQEAQSVVDGMAGSSWLPACSSLSSTSSATMVREPVPLISSSRRIKTGQAFAVN